MKYIKLFEYYQDIDAICYQYAIKDYTINKDGSIDAHRSINLRMYGLSKLPLKFNSVTGYFDCEGNMLLSLEGCPKYVGSYFNCSHNQLTSLEGCPKYVSINFNCNNNQLTTLKYFPKVNGNSITIYNNPLPKEILDNEKYIKDITKHQEDYKVWNNNGTLNLPRFEAMMEDIKNND